MSRGKIVGVRVSDELHAKLHEMAVDRNTSISDILRDIILENLDMSYRFSQWEVHAWNLFNLNADQVAYAKKASKNPEQFFSIISKWSKDTKIKVIPHPSLTLIEFQRRDKVYVIQESVILPKVQVVQSIVDQLAEKVEQEVEFETEGLCNGTTGGDIPQTGGEQQDKPGAGVPEGISREGYTDLSDLDDLELQTGPKAS